MNSMTGNESSRERMFLELSFSGNVSCRELSYPRNGSSSLWNFRTWEWKCQTP